MPTDPTASLEMQPAIQVLHHTAGYSALAQRDDKLAQKSI